MANPEHNHQEDVTKSWALAISGIVVLLSGAGLMNQFGLLGEFDISLSDYADIDDFLVGSINLLTLDGLRWWALVFSLALCGAMVVAGRLGQKYPGKKERSGWMVATTRALAGSTRRRIGLCGSVALFVIWPLSWDAGRAEAARIKNGNGCVVDASLRSTPSGLTRGPGSKLVLVAGLNSTVFLYEEGGDPQSSGVVHAVPIGNVAQLTYSNCNVDN